MEIIMNCWITPDGDVINCEWGYHKNILDKLFIKKQPKKNFDFEKYVEEKGWIRISLGIVYCGTVRPTLQQREVIEKNGWEVFDFNMHWPE
jgi:hypothetical protein